VYNNLENCTAGHVLASCIDVMPAQGKSRQKQKATVKEVGGVMGSARAMAQRQAAALLSKQSKRDRVPVSQNKNKDTESDEQEEEEKGGLEEIEVHEEEEEEEKEEEEEEEERVTEVRGKVVAQKKIKVLHVESQVLILFIFLRIQLSTDTLFVEQEDEVVSAEFGLFHKLEGATNKSRATSLQRVLVPWLISKYGMLYKNARMDVVIQMVEAIINRDNLLELGVQCHHAKKTHAIGFNTVVKEAKQAAGMCNVIHCLCIAFL
jgi:hypothetical protein